MTEHDAFNVWQFVASELGCRWAAMCGCGHSFGVFQSVTEALDAARPHFAEAEADGA